ADPRAYLSAQWSRLQGGKSLPVTVVDLVEEVLATDPPDAPGLVLSHNDVNPTNLIFDGERLLLLDWEAAGPNDRWFDLATVALFLRLDAEQCRRLLASYDGEIRENVPSHFIYLRRMVGTMLGTGFLKLARDAG